MMRKLVLGATVVCSLGLKFSSGADRSGVGNERLAAYFSARVKALENPFATASSGEEWKEREGELRRQLAEMLGLDPYPERSPLEAVVTGVIEREDIRVEKVHFQSMPGLYVTGNLYVPQGVTERLPAVLYVCGHGQVKMDGVSYGNKVAYHHHGVWLARNGYVCLLIDTLQLGEIEGIHHGTYRYGRWWWYSRGYTPAGVEAWNGIRALDYLESRPEVDGKRLGVTGRSGGGAYSWWVAALDERIQAAVPVAGITSLRNHVVDGCVEGHCDCMYAVNTYRWDFEQVAALVAPRPLLISNTDKDGIFPVEGVFQVFLGTRQIYSRLGAGAKLGLNIEEGPHKDTQPLQTAAFHWLNRHLRGTDLVDSLDTAARKVFEPNELKVFEVLPADERNTRIDESFVPTAAELPPPVSQGEWEERGEGWRSQLSEKCFRGWPAGDLEVGLRRTYAAAREGLQFEVHEVETEPEVVARLYLVHREGVAAGDLDLVVLNVLDEGDWEDFLRHIPNLFPEAFPGLSLPAAAAEPLEAERKMHRSQKWGMAYYCPRGIGPDVWPGEEKKRAQIQRRFALLGQTVDGMRVWDVLQGIRGLRQLGFEGRPVWVQAGGVMAGNALYASLFAEPAVSRLDLHGLPATHREGPAYLNVMRVWDMPQAVAWAAERTPVRLYAADAAPWEEVKATGKALGWDEKRFQLRPPAR